MNNIKNIFNVITLGTIGVDLILIAMSLYFIAYPTVGRESAILIIGIALLICGIYSIVKFIVNPRSFFKFELVYGILNIIIGMFAVFKPIDLTNFLTVMVGIWLIITSVFKLPLIIELKKHKDNSWLFDLTVVVLTLVMGIMLIVDPFNGFIALTIYSGIIILMYALIDIVEQMYLRKRAKTILKFFSK